MVGHAHQNLNGSRDLTTPLSGMICHLCDRTYYEQPAYQIWNFYLCPVWGYEKGYKMWKMGWFGLVRGHARSVAIAPFDRAHNKFLLAFYSNYVPIILHRFWDIPRYWSKIAYLNLLHVYLKPPLRVTRWNFSEIFGVRNNVTHFI